ncbi:MAG: hypothetical protein IID12_07270 [Candidatus Marinimicrobia bacterium]|nr:hypothetical protein [Candidatus Neomarinimicrobiota bacterium]
MNNHKWAYYCWENFKLTNNSNSRYRLVHLDFHWDGINDFQKESRLEQLTNIESIEDIKELVDQGQLIKHDSFIAPGIIRKIISEIHFYCLQDDTEEGIDDSLLNEYYCTQYKHNDIDALISHNFTEDIFFNLDLDLFNKEEYWMKGDLWEENDIVEFINKCSGIIATSSLVTIAKSPGYSGTKEDTNHLTDLVIPQIIKYFNG